MRHVRTRDFTVDIPIPLISSWSDIPLFIRINHSDFQPSDNHAKHHIRPHLLYTTGSANQKCYFTCHNMKFELIYSYLLVVITVSFSLQTTTQNCSKYQNLHWNLGRLTPSFGSTLAVRLDFYFFWIKTFSFSR